MASRYDDELWELVPEHSEPAPEHLRRFVRSLGRAEHALDLGCGDGRLTLEIDAVALTAADVSPVALARAERRLAERSVSLVELDPDSDMPFADSHFDLVLCAETLEHVRDVQLLLSEVRRVLRPRGRLAVSTPAHGRATALAAALTGFEPRFEPLSPHLRFFTRRSLTGVLVGGGFELQSVRRHNGSLLGVARR